MIVVDDSKITFQSVYESDFAPADTALRDTNLLLIPYRNYRPSVEYCFGEYAEDFLNYVKGNNEGMIKADIAISDENYKQMEMHSLLLDIGIFIVSNVVLPISLNLLSSFINDKIKNNMKKVRMLMFASK